MAALEENKALDLAGLGHFKLDYDNYLDSFKIGQVYTLDSSNVPFLNLYSNFDRFTFVSGGLMISDYNYDDNVFTDRSLTFVADGASSKPTVEVRGSSSSDYGYICFPTNNDMGYTTTPSTPATFATNHSKWDASAITSGTLSADRIPNISASKITSGTLPVERGGTGLTTVPSMLVSLASTASAGIFSTSPRPGVTGILPAAHGGTGVSNLKDLIKFEYTASTKTLNITVDESLLGA